MDKKGLNAGIKGSPDCLLFDEVAQKDQEALLEQLFDGSGEDRVAAFTLKTRAVSK